MTIVELERVLNLKNLLEKKSFFLFGPRSTGKSYLIEKQLNDISYIIDLLDEKTYLRFSQNPSFLIEVEQSIEFSKIIVIDEIQKLPHILDQVHLLIEKKKRKFLLTGSSARKIKTDSTNLLAGRAWEANLFPLIFKEIPNFNLTKHLQFGGLPQVYLAPTPEDTEEEIYAYVNTYLKEEIQREALVKKLPPFSRFLKVAALSNGQLINYASIANDSQISPSTVRNFFEILADTLVGFLVEPWMESKKRKAIQTSKFYFFDTGVARVLAGIEHLEIHSNLYGVTFENWIANELRAFLSYKRIKKPLCFWRSVNGQEVDFLIGDIIAVEVKSSAKISKSDLKGLKALKEENIFKKFYLISNDSIDRKIDDIGCLHWKTFLNQLWDNKVLD